jgi:protein-S-isoprenylcysteine O-methyltransferase Ste14
VGIDIRIPIGALFTIIGALLVGYGFWNSPAIYRRSLGININLWWGLVLLGFGLAMLLLAWRAETARRQRQLGQRAIDRKARN